MIQIAQIAPARSGQFLQLLGVSGDDLLQEADVPLQCLGDGRRVLVSPGRRNIVLSQKLDVSVGDVLQMKIDIGDAGLESGDIVLESGNVVLEIRKVVLKIRNVVPEIRNVVLKVRNVGLKIRNVGLETKNIVLQVQNIVLNSRNVILENSNGGCKIFCVYGNETFQIRIRYVVVFVGFCSRIFCRIYLSGYSISCPLSFIHAF